MSPWILIHTHTHTHVHTKDGTNLEFNSIEYRFEYPRHFEYESNTNIQWLQIRLEFLTVSRCLAGMRRHLVAMGTSPCRSRRLRSLCLLSDITITCFLTAAKRIITYLMCIYTHTRLQNKTIYIPVQNKIKKTNSCKTRHDLLGLRRLCIAR